MRPEQRVVVQMQLTALWDDDGELPIKRKRDVGRKELVDLLREGPVQFVVADSGKHLFWVNVDVAFRFWKEEVKPRLVEPKDAVNGFRLENFPGGYCYCATEWDALDETPVVLLDMHH